MQIIPGSTNLPLAQKISKLTKSSLAQVELSRFPNRESRVWINEPKIGKKVAVVQSFAIQPNFSIMEFCLIIDALRRSGTQHITAIIPWLGYCIQDKIFRQGEPLSSKVVVDIIEDLVSQGIEVYVNVNNYYKGSAPLTISRIRQRLSLDDQPELLVDIDADGVQSELPLP